jgi:hypothetical protein
VLGQTIDISNTHNTSIIFSTVKRQLILPLNFDVIREFKLRVQTPNDKRQAKTIFTLQGSKV